MISCALFITLYLFSLIFNTSIQVFEPFGQVELVQLPLDETGHCKGFGFVQVSDVLKLVLMASQTEVDGS